MRQLSRPEGVGLELLVLRPSGASGDRSSRLNCRILSASEASGKNACDKARWQVALNFKQSLITVALIALFCEVCIRPVYVDLVAQVEE